MPLPYLHRRFAYNPSVSVFLQHWWIFPSMLTRPVWDRYELFRFWRRIGAA